MKKRHFVIEKYLESKFFYLLLSLTILILILPHLSESSLGNAIVGLLYIMLSLTIIYTVRKKKKILWFFAILTTLSAIIKLLHLQYDNYHVIFKVSEDVIFLIISVISLFIIFKEVVRTKKVTVDTIFGSISVYLLIGLAYATIYHVIEIIRPGSFQYIVDHSRLKNDFQYVYFSFATLTTTGFGDIIALNPQAKSIVTIESITGVFYLAVLVSRLVGTLQIRH